MQGQRPKPRGLPHAVLQRLNGGANGTRDLGDHGLQSRYCWTQKGRSAALSRLLANEEKDGWGLEVRCKPAKAGAPGLASVIRVFSLAIVGPRSDGAPG